MFDTQKKAMMVRAGMLITSVLMTVGAASAVMNMTEAFQPIIDMIGVITGNTDTWVALVVLSVILGMAVAVGYFVRGILTTSVGKIHR